MCINMVLSRIDTATSVLNIIVCSFLVPWITAFIPSEYCSLKDEIVIDAIGAKPSVQFTESAFPQLVHQFANHSSLLSVCLSSTPD